MIQVRLQKL